MYGTFWALVPALIAILLALITKEVYSSLFVGIVIGALFYSNFNIAGTVTHVIDDGLLSVLTDKYNVGILLFLVMLGILVTLINKSGGSKAFGNWASKNIKSKTGAMLATVLLGVLIFIDDYFNCLTVGSVMRPLTDKHKISRVKLAYLIDATAAPVCIIAPISSWAAAVSSYIKTDNGLALFINAIPYNYYAIFTLSMLVIIAFFNFDFKSMKKFEKKAQKGDLSIVKTLSMSEQSSKDGKVYDLIIPIVVLIVFCVFGMIYSGGFFNSEEPISFVTAFANSDASVGLVIGSMFSLIITIIYYLCRKIISFKSCMDSLVEGIKNMSAAILILTFAWTLKSMTDSLGVSVFVETIIGSNIEKFSIFIPSVVFLIGAFISFSTGTSWGTFGILLPIVYSIFSGVDETLLIMSISACMAGSVFGDHCSPISDTTIMSSAGAQCEHIQHVNTQLPYAIYVAIISLLSYVVASLTKSVIIPLIFGFVVLFVSLYLLKKYEKK